MMRCTPGVGSVPKAKQFCKKHDDDDDDDDDNEGDDEDRNHGHDHDNDRDGNVGNDDGGGWIVAMVAMMSTI